MSQHNENKKTCNCKTPCKNCTCNPSTSSSKETASKPYFGTYPGDMEDFIIGIIDRKPRKTTIVDAIK